MLDVAIYYSDLVLPIRKGLASRLALLALKEAASDAKEPRAMQVSRLVNGALETLRVPIDSPDTERLDQFVAEQLKPLLSLLTMVRSTGGVCCTECTGAASVACDGVDDTRHVEPNGHCVRPLRECCELAVRTLRRLYGSLPRTNLSRRAVVNFQVAEACPSDAVHCVSGASLYKDGPTNQLTEITLHVGLYHWELSSYAAIALILAHELVCHAAHGSQGQDNPRASTSPDDRYVEGWMDFVSRLALLEEVGVSPRHGRGSSAAPVNAARALAVAGEIGAWRTAEIWKSACNEKRYDAAASSRRYGGDQASFAQAIFRQLGAPAAFFEFSAAFNAADTKKAERDAFLYDIEAVSCMIGPETQPVTRALRRFAETRDIDEFLQSRRSEGGR